VIPMPPRPESLSKVFLDARKAYPDAKFEREELAQREKVEAAERWVEAMLVRMFVAQKMGADERDDQFMDLTDELFDVVRASFTRQDLIRLFIEQLYEAARARANKEYKAMINDVREEIDNMAKGIAT
jgi:Mg2+ and Co2+ transporter CorA